MDGVGLRRGSRTILRDVDWCVGVGERWVVLGRNGSGKTSLLRVASLALHPTRGSVRVLGELLGRTDVRQVRRRIAISGGGLADQLRAGLPACDLVMTAKYAALEPWWHDYSDGDRERAVHLLKRMQVGHVAHQPFGTLSAGERQRVLLARALMTEPELLLFDEPTAGLDLAGREALVTSLAALAADRTAPAMVLVTHHLEEIPAGFDHVLMLRDGQVLASGPLDDLLDTAHASACFGLELSVERDTASGRWTARADHGGG
jgi:iron complex transport system ATP-binding protein